jgi:hypothetical protein
MGVTLAIFLLIALTQEGLTHEGKSISIFNVVKFPNDACQGSGNQNGTCYTAEECSNIGGVNAGTCAEGYGVCCTISLTCTTNDMVHSSSQNNTHLILTATTTPPQRCDYSICPLSSSICRIRFDFEVFTIAGPYVFTVADIVSGGADGKCQTDTFSATGSLGGSPVICGGNQNQHMFVDTDGTECVTANFAFGGTTTTNRQFNLKVMQYDCLDKDNGGPSGCLQYFTPEAGLVSSYNYPVGAAAVLSAAANPATAFQHLASQSYAICFRQARNRCALCFRPDVSAAAAGQSFGLSRDMNGGKSAVDANCLEDYLVIPGAMINEAAATANPKVLAGVSRICGAFFRAADNLAGSVDPLVNLVCTGDTPFRLRFETDADEAEGADMMTSDELNLGIVGFSLDYWQVACP